MKVLIGTDTYVPSVNGVVTSTLNLKEGLEELGHEVRIITLSVTGSSYFEDNVYYVGSLDVGRVYPGARLKTKPCKNEVEDILKWKPDIVHTQSEFSMFPIAARLAKKLEVPLVHTYHTMYEDYTHYFMPSKTVGKKMVSVLTNIFSDFIDGMIAPAQKTYKLLNDYGVTCPLKCIPSGISIEKFEKKQSKETIKALKAKLNIPKKNCVMLSVSRIGKEKNVSELIKNVKQLENVSLVIVGDGPQKKELEELVKWLNITDKVIFTGMVDPSDVPLYYSMADLFVSASTSETQGLTYIEALACGTPLLCRKDDCLKGVIEEGKNGYCFETRQEFIAKFDLFINRPDKKEMAEYAKKTSHKFSKQSFAKNALKFYEELIVAKQKSNESGIGKRFSFDDVI